MDDKELFEQLERGPLARNGFDERLRGRILEEIDRPGRRRKPRVVPLARIGAACAMVFAVLIGVWIWQSNDREAGMGAEDRKMQSASPSASAPIALTTEPPRSVMLIGLRKDIPEGQAGGPSSTYRSILVAPESGKLTVDASLNGIYMPYKQKFYRLDAVGDSLGKGAQTIASVPAGQGEPAAIAVDPAYRTNEKLLFAGNKYVSLLQTKTAADTGETTSHVWVKDITQLDPALRETASAAGEEPHYPLSQLVTAAGESADEWTIARQAGEWVGKVPTASANALNPEAALANIAETKAISAQLPPDVASYDTLWLSWDDIRAREPAAVDAFTSPTQDILAVQTAGAIRVFAYRMQESDMGPLTIPLENGESVVMVQWAQDNYVDAWKTMLRQWIGTASADRL